MDSGYHLFDRDLRELYAEAPAAGLLLALLDGGLALRRAGRRAPLLPCTVLWLAPGPLSLELDAARGLLLALPEALHETAAPERPWVLDALSGALLLEGVFEPERPVATAELQALAALLAHRLLATATEDASRRPAGPGAEPPLPTDPLARAQDAMRARLDEAPSLADLAQAAGVTPRRLAYLFQKHLGRSPMRVLQELRMQEAARCLQETDLTVSQVARAVGYADLASFSHAFSRCTGQSPSAYRDALKWLL